MARILDGKKLGEDIAASLRVEFMAKEREGFVRPRLAIVQIGNNPESEAYIRNKKRFGERVGAEVTHVHLPEEITEAEALHEISLLNADEGVHGIIVQLPLPKHLHKERLIEAVSWAKDVDGLTAVSVKGLWINSAQTFVPATTRGIMLLLEHHDVGVSGKSVVMVGRSALVGKPTSLALINAGATVTVCHSGTKDLEYHTLEADIIISAVGRPRLITRAHVKPRQVIVDVGTTVEEVPERRLVGDVDFDDVSSIVDAISPVPGGVGPMTVASLFLNLRDAYLKKLVI